MAGYRADSVAQAEAVRGARNAEPSVFVGGVLVGGGVRRTPKAGPSRRRAPRGRRRRSRGPRPGGSSPSPTRKGSARGLCRRTVAVKGVRRPAKKALDAVWSPADPPDTARLDCVKGGADRRHELHQILHAIGSGANQHIAKTQCRDALLELDAAVHRDEGIILAVHSAQQLAVLDPAPAATGNGVDGMTKKFRSKAYR